MNNTETRALKLFFISFRWQPESKFAFNLVKLPSRNTNREFAENQEVEVLSKSNDQDTCGWWKAIVKVT